MRDARIELFRAMLMLGICLLHSVWFGIHSFHPLVFVLMPCVDGFVFISGYFGVRFSISKVVRLVGVGLFCAFVATMMAGGGAVECWKVFNGYWFLHAYLFMMCFAPIVNVAVENLQSRRMAFLVFWPLLALVFGWGMATELPILHRIIPCPSGIGSFSGVTLLGVYAIGRIFRKFEFEKVLSMRCLVGLAIVLLGIVNIGNGWFAHYCSPFAVLLAVVMFCLFHRMPEVRDGFFRKSVLLIGPSLFSVYLLHTHVKGFRFIRSVVRYMVDLGIRPLVACCLLAVSLFFVCICIDVLRRLLLWGLACGFCVVCSNGSKKK